MTFFKAIASSAAGFVLARAIMSIGYVVTPDPISPAAGMVMVGLLAALWVGCAAAIAIVWSRLEDRSAHAEAPQDVPTVVAG